MDQIERFLTLVAQAILQGKVLVHCEGGSGRTGTMGAAYWIARGLSAEEAIAHVRRRNRSAVETDMQRHCLAAFAAVKRNAEAE